MVAPGERLETLSDLAQFELRDMVELSRAIRVVARESKTMESAAGAIVRLLHGRLSGRDTGDPNCALVRCFKTHRLDRLPLELARQAHRSMTQENSNGEMPCLTLLATAGSRPEWNDRRRSSGHAVIPLESVAIVERAPMIAALIRQMGLEIETALYPSAELMLDAEQRAFNVFHVEHAEGDASIPAQDFVRAHGIRSVLGFGGWLLSGELFAVILFTRVAIDRKTARLFRTVALAVKLALLPYTHGRTFEDDEEAGVEAESGPPLLTKLEEQLRSETTTLRLLLAALEDAALDQTARLQLAYTDLQLQGETVRAQGERLSSMLEATSDAVFLLDSEWRFTFVNGQAQELIAVGVPLIGQKIWELYPDAVGTNFWVEYRRAMYEGLDVKFQEYYPAPLDRWFLVHAFPNEGGIAVFFHDVSARLKTEATLRQTEKLAAAGRLAASLAHEINNPLEAVTNLLFLVNSDGTLKEDTKGYVALAESELKRVSEITTHMLRFHRHSTLASEVDLVEILESVLILFKGRLDQANIAVRRRFEEGAVITGHAGELRQVMANLIGNAIDASRLGGHLELRLRPCRDVCDGRRGVRLTIADAGSGMSKAVLMKIFEPFFTTKGVTGSGLGLWVTLDLVKKHEGKIAVRSSTEEPWRGTVFSLFFPEER